MSDIKKEYNIDTYSIQEDWLKNIAPKYMNIKDHNMLRIGLLGYINEIMSSSLEDSHNMSNMYYNELIPSRAQLPETIYTNASIIRYDDFKAQGSSLYFTLAINKQDLIEQSVDRITHREFYISRNSYMNVDGKYNFILDYPISIILKSNYDKNGNIEWVFTPKYNMQYTNDRSDIDAPYINSFTTTINKDEFLMLNLKGRQYSIDKVNFSIFNDDIIDNLSFRIPYTGQLSHFNVYYECPGKQPILLKNYFMDNLEPDDDYFCFYKFVNDTTFEIFFSPYEHYFRPEIGTNLRVEVFTTEGESANFVYEGSNTYFSFEQDQNDSNSLEIDYSRVVTFVRANTRSVGGKDTKSLNEIKKKVINDFSLRNSIVTESDLNIYFNEFKDDSSIIFIKKRDDIIKRLFTAFIIFKDENSNILPTNTVTFSVDEDDIDLYSDSQEIYMLKAGKEMVLDNNSHDTYYSVENDNLLVKRDTTFRVASPFLIKFAFNPIKATYYFNSINTNIINNYTFINKNSYHEYSVNSIDIKRNALISDNYEFTFEFTTNDKFENIFKKNEQTGGLIDTEYIKLKGIFKDGEKMIGYVDFIPYKVSESAKKIYYRAQITTSDFIDIEEMLEIEDGIKIIEKGLGITSPSLFLPSDNLRMEICCFVKSDSLNNVTPTVSRLGALNELNGYSLMNIYETEQNIKLFRNLDSMLNSRITLGLSTRSSKSFTAYQVPVFGYEYLLDSDPERIFNVVNDYIEIIENNLDKLENNFNVDLKFFNTYGKSKYFSIGDGVNSESINQTNISIKFRIKTHMPIDHSIMEEIKQTIIKYIEEETNTEGTKEIYISNIVSLLQKNYSEIAYVHLVGINDFSNDKQIIENNVVKSYDNIQNLSNYVPEYINIDKKRTIVVNYQGEQEIVYEPSVEIEFL